MYYDDISYLLGYGFGTK